MEMEDHHNHNHHPQQYGMADLRQLMNGGARPTPPHFPAPPTAAEVFQPHRNLTHHHYDMMMLDRHVADVVMPRGLHDFASDSPAAAPPPPATTASASTPPSLSGLDGDTTGCLGGDASTGRWPRQETLTLLDIRSRLDPKFKDANHKGPLWDEVSRYVLYYSFLPLPPSLILHSFISFPFISTCLQLFHHLHTPTPTEKLVN